MGAGAKVGALGAIGLAAGTVFGVKALLIDAFQEAGKTAFSSAERSIAKRSIADAAANAGRRSESRIGTSFRDSAEEGGRSEPRLVSPTIPPPLTFPAPINTHPSDAVLQLYESAQLAIIKDIDTTPEFLTQDQIANIINKELAKFSTKHQDKTEFQIVTGKLIIDKKFSVPGLHIGVGEINIYKITIVLAGSIYACQKFTLQRFDHCVDDAFQEIKKILLENVSEGTPAPAKAEAK